MSPFNSGKKYCLVKYVDDNILNVVLVKSMTYIEDNLFWAPYKRMGHYEATPLDFANDRKILEQKMKRMKIEDKQKQENQSRKLQIDNMDGVVSADKQYSDYRFRTKQSDSEVTKVQLTCVSNDVSGSSSFSEDNDDSIADPDYRLESDNEQARVIDNKNKRSSLYSETSNLPESQESSVYKEHLISQYNHCALSKIDSKAREVVFKENEIIVTNVNVGENLNEDQENVFMKKIPTYRPENSTHLNIRKISHSKSNAKKYFCIFCKKLFSKLALHLERIHHDEPLVNKFVVLPKGCEERRKIIEIIRKEGSFQFNTDENHNIGDMIVSRRPTKDLVKTSSDYKTCPSCKEMYSKKSIRKHYPKCVPNWKKGDRFVTVMSKRVRADIHKSANSVLRDMVFPLLREDEITKIIRYDQLVIAYGNCLCTKYRLTHLHKMIRSKLRLIGRFLIEMKKIDHLFTDFASIYYPEKFDNVILAVNKTAKLNDLIQEYKSPATASHLGTTLKKCGKLLVTLCIKNRERTRKTLVEDFLKILEEDFAAIVNKTVMENQLQYKRSKQIKLPTVQEVSKFNNYLDVNCQKYFNALLNGFDFVTWKELASYTLISIQTFNRRRAGELERATVEDFRNYQNIENDDPAFLQSLPEDYQVNAKRYWRFEIRGKKARGVPVLLSKKLFECVELILQNREKAGVSPSNPYLFGIPGKSYVPLHLKACDLMRKFAEESGVENHHLIRGTQLRKQIATQSSVLNLDENEVSDLANFLGHAEKVHRDHYRIPIVSREIGRVSKFLEMGVRSDSPSIGNCMQMEYTDTSEQTEYNSEQSKNSLEEITSEQIENESTDLDLCSRKKDSWSELNSSTTLYGKKRCVSPIGPVKRTSWSTPEKKRVLDLFGSNIETGELPTLPECFVAVKSYAILQNRSPAQLKAWVHNEIKKKSKGIKSINRRVYWTSAEKEIMHQEFAINLDDEILPSLSKCDNVRKKYPELQHRNNTAIKAWINNTIKKRKLQNQ